MKKSISFIGSLLVDKIKMIDHYPAKGALCEILEEEQSIGGLAANTSVSLKKLSPDTRISVFGAAGDDKEGEYIRNFLASYGIDTNNIIVKRGTPTSYTDVMTEKLSGQRTFFQEAGACAQYCAEDIRTEKINTDYAHLGYILLLKQLDAYINSDRTGMSVVLEKLKEQGVITSVDLVSEESDRYQSVLKPSLPYIDYLFANEFELEKASGVSIDKGMDNQNIASAAKILLAGGVQKAVVVHAPSGGWIITKLGDVFFQPSLTLPKGYIKGTVGAGDTFCAGVLCALMKEWDYDRCIMAGNLAAASNLSEKDSTSGVRALSELWEEWY